MLHKHTDKSQAPSGYNQNKVLSIIQTVDAIKGHLKYYHLQILNSVCLGVLPSSLILTVCMTAVHRSCWVTFNWRIRTSDISCSKRVKDTGPPLSTEEKLNTAFLSSQILDEQREREKYMLKTIYTCQRTCIVIMHSYTHQSYAIWVMCHLEKYLIKTES